jgi:hypothetical protein
VRTVATRSFSVAQPLANSPVHSGRQAIGEMTMATGVVAGQQGLKPGAILSRRQRPPAGQQAALSIGLQGGRHPAGIDEHRRQAFKAGLQQGVVVVGRCVFFGRLLGSGGRTHRR